MRLMKVALVATALLLFCGMSFAQSDWRWQRDRDRDDYSRQDDKKAYDHGFRDGQNDRNHRRSAHPRHNDRAYLAGYRAGYGDSGWRDRRRDNDHDADDGYGRDGRWGHGPYGQQNTQNAAYNNGYQEGLRYGQADRNNGHSYRPTYSDNYKHGVTGYMASYGDKNVYRQNFQQGFRAGYDRGYGR